jgi:UDP-3-O-[3-hydroxymyristoyl] glucosamine N-acyltransferase
MSRPNCQYSLSDLSARFELELHGKGEHLIDGVGTLSTAGPSNITFLANPAYRKQLASTRAGAVILKAQDLDQCTSNCLIADDPYLAYARLATLFDPRPADEPGIHPSAVIDPSARISASASIGPLVAVGPESVVEDGVSIAAGCAIDANCRIGAGSILHANVTLAHGVRIGQRVIIHSGAVIGADGFGIAFASDHWEKVPQLGGVRIGDDCEIGANTTIDRGAIDDTVLEEDVRIDNQVQIAHNVYIGAHTAIAGLAGIAGSAKIGKYCLIAGRGGVSGHLEIADRVTLTANSIALRSITEAGTTWGAQLPAQPMREWQRNLSRLRKLDELARSVRKIEKNLEAKKENE